MTTVYLVTLHVGEKELPTILGAIAGSAKLVSVTPTEEAKAEKPTARDFHYVDNKRNKGISGEDLLLQTLGKEPRVFHVKEIEAAFEKHRFSGNSVSPILHRLLAAEKIRRVGTASYCLVGTVLKLGASS
jgi:hypothetical protein